MRNAELLSLGLIEIAQKIRTGEVTSLEVTEAMLSALDKEGRALNATARVHAEAAREEAARCDAERRRGILRGALHGVPLAHKDMFHHAGRPSEMGSLIFKNYVPQVTATVIERLSAAGSIDVGRLNMVEFALGVTGHNDHTGHPKNAWNPERVTGGSTSGGATAVAARLTFATLGSDTGGSIRTPSSLCGVVGIKPTYGRVSRANAMPLSFSLDHVGPIARSAADCALMLELIAGFDPKDGTTSRRPVERYRQRIGQPIKGLRVTLATEEGFEGPLDDDVRNGFAEAGRVLAEIGLEATKRPLPPMEPLNALRRLISVVEVASLHETLVRTRPHDYNVTTTSRMLPGFAAPASAYLRALSARAGQLRAYCDAVFADADIIALPTIPQRPPTIAETSTGGDARYVQASNELAALIGAFNYLGLPALSTPMGFDRDGMPMGLQLVGRPFAEAQLLAVAEAFESATGFAVRRPAWLERGGMPARA
ncbi:aspartyl/glutamyl-tRNA(Asn/Gln) amidotransferase subunit A [Arboricoccus pini]|uniref:Aspartyl/glutamyl-tRNA(Asn/Gln) amidotransferase subunit A n=1 Tax=Arboricoccus pini TaxID=1963835 RepID=A0A212RCA6_9PROT|nr:amidase [Arboricoccus pini]SNB69872.1 aspartyl/glutamyl-tRNA(Asn/Gln) amidotransferase subunit A [Arboricoccus pini]